MDVHRKSRAKPLLLFIIVALAVHLLAVFFLTEGGLARLYPFVARAYAEELTPSGNSYAVYYDVRLSVAESDILVVGIDPETAQSYDVLGHFIRFAKQYSNIGNIVLAEDRQTMRQIARLVCSTDMELRGVWSELLKSQFGVSDDFADFLEELAYVNGTTPPIRKFTVSSMLDENGEISVETLYSEFISTFNETGQTTLAAVDISLLDDAEFSAALESRFGDRLLILKTRYSDGASFDDGLNMPFTGSEPRAYFVCGDRMEWFYDYVNWALNVFSDGNKTDYAEAITGDNQGFFFVITHGTPITYTESATVADMQSAAVADTQSAEY